MPTVLHSGNYVLDGNAVLGPDSIVFQEKPVVGLRMDGVPQKQGYNAMEWHYATVPGDEMKLLQSAWLTTRGQGLSVTFINRDGVQQTDFLYMQQPVIGRRRTFYYDSVVIRFTATYRTGIDATSPLQAGSSAGYDRFLFHETYFQSVESSELFGIPVVHIPMAPIRFSSIASEESFGTFTITIASPEVPVPTGPFDPPISIDPGETGTSDYIAEAKGRRSRTIGPWAYQGNLYVLAFYPDPPDSYNTNIVAIYKSADGGFTWAEQDSAHHISTQLDSDRPTGTAYMRGATVYVLWYTSDQYGHISTFSLSTDLWGPAMALSASAVDSSEQGYIAVRSNDDIVPVYIEWPDFMDTFYSVYSGASWVVDHTRISSRPEGPFEEFKVLSTLVDSSDRVHVFAYRYSDYTSNRTLVHRGINADNTLGSQTVVVAAGDVTIDFDKMVNASDIAGDGTMGVLYLDGSDQAYITLSSDDGDAPTWTAHTVTGVGDTPRALVWDGTQWCVFFRDGANGLSINVWSGTAWTTTALIASFDGYGIYSLYARRIAIGRIGVTIVDGNFGMHYLEYAP